MSQDAIVRHCSPTLAGMKTGSLFTCEYADKREMLKSIRKLNQCFIKKGLRALPLRFQNNKALIYIFRPTHLSRDLKNTTAIRLLTERGYCCEEPEKCILHLMKRLGECEEFPHEIGLFLGYPPEDVCGFIENKACGCKCVGYWKVYGDVESAKELFARYKECTECYCSMFAKGVSIEHLTVAS